MVRRTVCVTAAALAVGLLSAGLSAQRKNSTQPVSMTIGIDKKVLGDHLGYIYTDYRAANGGTCVEVTADQVFVRFNRHYPSSSTSDFQYCEKAEGGRFYDEKRQFWLEISDPAACGHFNPASGPDPNLDPLHVRQPFAYWIAGGSACRVNGSDKPRVRAADAFKAKVGSRTPVVFLILSYDSQIAFEVQGSALVQGTSASRILTNGGETAVTLVKNSNKVGEPNTTLGTFAMPFELTFTKVQ